jgi:hypothetical protein
MGRDHTGSVATEMREPMRGILCEFFDIAFGQTARPIHEQCRDGQLVHVKLAAVAQLLSGQRLSDWCRFEKIGLLPLKPSPDLVFVVVLPLAIDIHSVNAGMQGDLSQNASSFCLMSGGNSASLVVHGLRSSKSSNNFLSTNSGHCMRYQRNWKVMICTCLVENLLESMGKTVLRYVSAQKF